jgi:TRAP-type mannitol/chloroaromatic compound transport system permease large subunit
LLPVAKALEIDLVWFGVLIGANLQTSFLTPPFGFALFYLRGVAPSNVKTQDIYRGVIPFIIIQILVLVLIIAFPELVNFLLEFKW